MTERASTEAWFPMAFERDLEVARIDRVHVGELAVALYLEAEGRPVALVDRCPHRAARLSDGRVVDGTIECGYHGWRFDRSGACVHAPQQPTGVQLPMKACARPLELALDQGIVWGWGGAPGEGTEVPRPTIPALEGSDLHTVDFVMDLPYGQDYFIENVLDVAHIHIAHSGTRGGGHRSLAGPLEFEIEDRGELGFTSSFKTLGLGDAEGGEGLVGARVSYEASNLVHYESRFEEADRVSGLALYSIPFGPGRCRMLYRAYGNIWSPEDLTRPTWKEHVGQCALLEEDMSVVRGQAAEIDGSTETLAEMWTPLRTSDRLVLAYREWVDEYAPKRPGAIGLRSVGDRGDLQKDAAQDRWTLHTRHCAPCKAALARFRAEQRGARTVSLASIAIACLASGSLALAAVVVAVGAHIFCGFARRRVSGLTETRGAYSLSHAHMSRAPGPSQG